MMSSRADSADFERLFLNNTPFIDTRSPAEFAQGAFPGAVNLPLMTDDERKQVGTCYKQEGQLAAIALGHRLVQGALKDERVNAWREFIDQHLDGYLYCFRGGLRSQIAQHWLAESGYEYPRIIGGYKAMRRFLVDLLAQFCQTGRIMVLSGQTGCAKTQLLQQLNSAVDLECLANHRGSAFGKRIGGQPSQIDFENALSIDLLKLQQMAHATPIVFEDESHLIGRIVLPEVLHAAMNQAPLAVIEMTLEERVEHTYQNYILHKLVEWQQHAGTYEGFAGFSAELLDSLQRLQKRLGGWRYQQLLAQMQAALAAHQSGSPELHRAWIRTMLKEYYDPMYLYQLDRKADRVVFRGSYQQALDYLQDLQA